MKQDSCSKRIISENQCLEFLGQLQKDLHNDLLVVGSENGCSRTILSILDELKLPRDELESKISLTLQNAVLSFSSKLRTLETKDKRLQKLNSKPLPVKREPVKLFLSNDFDRVRQLYIGVLDSVYCLLGRCPSSAAMKQFCKRYFIYSLLCCLEEKFKGHTAYLVCKLAPPSEKPKFKIFQGEIPGVVIGGWIRRYFLSKKISQKEKIQLAMSLQNSKRAAKAFSKNKSKQYLTIKITW